MSIKKGKDTIIIENKMQERRKDMKCFRYEEHSDFFHSIFAQVVSACACALRQTMRQQAGR